jgi:hypothetical protein
MAPTRNVDTRRKAFAFAARAVIAAPLPAAPDAEWTFVDMHPDWRAGFPGP